MMDQLKELAVKTGIGVREERLHREVGYTVSGGICRIDGSEYLLLDSGATAADCIEVLLDFLSQRDLDDLYIEPQLRRLIGGRADAGEASEDRVEDAATTTPAQTERTAPAQQAGPDSDECTTSGPSQATVEDPVKDARSA